MARVQLAEPAICWIPQVLLSLATLSNRPCPTVPMAQRRRMTECVDLCPCFAILGCSVTTTLITSKIIGDCVIGISCFSKFPSTTLTYFDNHPGSSSFLEEVQVPLNLAPSEVTTNSAGSGGKGTW